MEKGRITKLAAWKSGKGFFVGIDNKEYVILAATDAKVGDVVDYELANKYVYGKQVISKLLLPLEAYEAPARDEDRAKTTPVFRAHDTSKLDSREQYWANKEKHDLAKEPIHIRLECISSAAQVYSGAQGQDEKILELAAKFEKFAKGNNHE